MYRPSRQVSTGPGPLGPRGSRACRRGPSPPRSTLDKQHGPHGQGRSGTSPGRTPTDRHRRSQAGAADLRRYPGTSGRLTLTDGLGGEDGEARHVDVQVIHLEGHQAPATDHEGDEDAQHATLETVRLALGSGRVRHVGLLGAESSRRRRMPDSGVPGYAPGKTARAPTSSQWTGPICQRGADPLEEPTEPLDVPVDNPYKFQIGAGGERGSLHGPDPRRGGRASRTAVALHTPPAPAVRPALAERHQQQAPENQASITDVPTPTRSWPGCAEAPPRASWASW